MPETPPRENLVRAMSPGLSNVRMSTDGPPRLTAHFARYNEWNLIDSVYEGRFLERVAPGAFAESLARSTPKIQFNHGKDPEIGEKLIAIPRSVPDDPTGPLYDGDVLDGLPPLLLAGLRAGLYGSSYRFTVTAEDVVRNPTRSVHNPDGITERTITKADVYENGPVTWPADAGAGFAAVRSLTDHAPEPVSASAPVQPTPRKDHPMPVEYITREEKASRVTELKDEQSRMAAENTGVPPTDVQERLNASIKEQDALEADIKWIDELRARVERNAGNTGASAPTREGPYSPPTIVRNRTEGDIYDLGAIRREARSVEDLHQKVRDNAMRAAEQMRIPGERFDEDKGRERVAELIEFHDTADKSFGFRVIKTNAPQYRSAFNQYVASGGEERGTALAVGVDATGGYSVPVSFDPTVIPIGAHTAINSYRAQCRIETIVGTDTYQVLTATAITAAWATEAAAATEQGPTFARPEFIAKRGHAFVTASYEMLQDRPSLPGDLGKLFGEAKDNLEESSFTTGVGTTVYPQGMGLKDAVTRTDSITNDTVAVADIRALEAAVPIRHRFNAQWFLSRAAIRAIQAFETTGGQLFGGVNYASVGNPVARGGGNTGLTLLGYPVNETPSMPWTPTTDDTTWGVLIDPKNYLILDRVGASIRVIPDMLDGATPSVPTGETGIYFFWRGTARVLNADGGRQGAVQ